MARTNTTAKKEEVVVQPAAQTEEQLKATMNSVIEGLTTVSSKIRALDAKGYTRSQIAKFLDKRYQHVRNVLITPVKSPSAPAPSKEEK